MSHREIKRLASIEDKLKRYDWLTLSEMQDIAGCRVITSSVRHLYRLVAGYREKYSTHELDSYNDYLSPPKSDGYRGYHLIYKYRHKTNDDYDGLKIEIQFRSGLQHAWATAVETVDIFYQQGLKSHRGDEQWRRFFALMGTAMAVREGCKRVPRTPRDDAELIRELRQLAEELEVAPRLKQFGETLRVVEDSDVRRSRIKYIVVVLDPTAGTTTLYGFRAGQIDEASNRYATLERFKSRGSDAVLVSVSDAAALQRAYPNYFLDTNAFLRALSEAID